MKATPQELALVRAVLETMLTEQIKTYSQNQLIFNAIIDMRKGRNGVRNMHRPELVREYLAWAQRHSIELAKALTQDEFNRTNTPDQQQRDWNLVVAHASLMKPDFKA